MSEYEIDKLDIEILRMLQIDARKSFKEIADQCEVSMETIKNRLNIMKKKGIIRGTTIIIDPKKLDKKNIVIFGIQITHPFSDQVLNMVKKIEEMCVVTRTIGPYDLEAIGILKDIEQIGTTKNMIGDFQQVKNVDVDILVDKTLLCYKNFEFK
ncbi:Lrp/AsnC family transcriptional regulator [[Eubacterium] cellulosolvens]